VRLGISRTFQLCRPFVGMTVLENVKVGGLSQPAPPQGRDAHALELIEQVGLAGKEHMPVEQMAYGDQRRLEIARALATAPKLLLLDEPFAGLGPGEIAELSALIRRIHRETGLTVLLIEHKLREFMKLVDRVIALDFGEVIADDTPERIVAHPRVIDGYIGTEGPDEEVACRRPCCRSVNFPSATARRWAARRSRLPLARAGASRSSGPTARAS